MTYIDIVDTNALHTRLGFGAPYVQGAAQVNKPLVDWKMEEDDAPILSYLYAHAKPQHHFEFGTWQGFGATLCARACDAEIWTVNLPDGEVHNGEPAYASQADETAAIDGATKIQRGAATIVQTDSGPFIGHMYREAGFTDRVHQMLADSAKMPLDSFAAEFFDTTLIDGGHTAQVVAADTERALAWLRPGGLCFWHDFCPHPEVLRRNTATFGVAQAVSANWAQWSGQLRDAFWIRKSCILVGVRA